MSGYPWGKKDSKSKRDTWLRDNGLYSAFRSYLRQALAEVDDDVIAEETAVRRIMADWKRVAGEKMKDAPPVSHAPVREDWYWAFEHYGDGIESDDHLLGVSRKDAPSPFAWSLLVGALKHDTSWKNLQDKVSKDLFGGDISDDDDRALIATGLPSALRERFSGVLATARSLFAGQLPAVFGRPEGS